MGGAQEDRPGTTVKEWTIDIYSMEVTQAFICECNNRNYNTKIGLNQHRRTKAHVQWENAKELRELKIELTKKDNKIMELEVDKKNLQYLNLILMKKISTLEESARVHPAGQPSGP